MSIMQNVRSVVSKFNSVSPLSAVTRQDIKNCEELTRLTGLSWTPVQYINPLLMGRDAEFVSVEYHGHMYDQKGEVFAMRVQEAINKASKPEGTDPRNYTNRPRVFSNVDIYDTPYVGIDRNEYGEAELLLKRLRNVDPEKLRGDIGAAIQEASDFVETNRKIAEKNASLERD